MFRLPQSKRVESTAVFTNPQTSLKATERHLILKCSR